MSLAYFPMYPDDFEADTAHLTLAEDGAYNRLLRLCWRTPGCSIPADRQWIYRRLRALSDDDRAVVDTVLDEFFVESDARFSNARLTKEWLAANEAHERRKNAGSKGGKNKSLKTKETGSSNAKAKPKQPEPEPEPEPEVREGAKAPLSANAAAPVHASEASEAVSSYNAAAEKAGWPKVQRMSPSRTRALKARLRECGGIEGWQHALKRAIDSDFLCGRTPKAWAGFSFDWMTKAANFTKLMEGNYDNRDRQPANAESDPTLRAIARAAGAF